MLNTIILLSRPMYALIAVAIGIGLGCTPLRKSKIFLAIMELFASGGIS